MICLALCLRRGGKTMLDGNRCEVCRDIVDDTRARHKQTKYCTRCAKHKKRENSLDPLHPTERRAYMRSYMRAYRRTHPRLSTRYVRAHRKKRRILRPALSGDVPAYADLTSSSQIVYSASAVLFCVGLLTVRHAAGITFEAVQAFISRSAVTVVELTGLVVIGIFSWRHVRDLWRDLK
jgi:hypothetical protein